MNERITMKETEYGYKLYEGDEFVIFFPDYRRANEMQKALNNLDKKQKKYQQLRSLTLAMATLL